MRGDWQTKPLGEVTTFINGLWKGEKPPYVTVGVIRNTNFTKDGSIDESHIAFLEVEAKKFAKRKLQYGDIILEKSGGGPKQPVGRVALFKKQEGDYSFSNFTSAIRVSDSRQLDFCFLHKFLFWKYTSGVTEAMQSHSTGIRNLNADAYKEIPVPLPSLSEQQRIVGILDEAFAGLATATANAEKNLKNARELFESYRESIFEKKGDDWIECELGQLIEIKHGFAFRSEYFTSDGDYVLLTPGNFFEEGGYRDRGAKQKYYVGEIPDGFILNKGDFLIAMTEQAAGLLGSSIIVPEDNKFLHNQRLGLVKLKPGTQWSNDFFFHAFNTKRFRQEAHDSASGVKVRHTSPTKLGQISVSFPESREQQDVVATQLDNLLEETARLTERYELKLSAISELKQSILQKAFAGELTSPPSQTIKEAAE